MPVPTTNARAYSGIRVKPNYGVTLANALIDVRRPDICDISGIPIPRPLASTVAWVGVVSSDYGWAQLGWQRGSEFGPLNSGDVNPPTGFGWHRHYFEYLGTFDETQSDLELRYFQYYRFFPPFPTPTPNQSVFYQAHLFDPQAGMWSLYFVDDDFNFVSNNRALTEWRFKRGASADYTSECFGLHDRIPGTRANPCVFQNLGINDAFGQVVGVEANPSVNGAVGLLTNMPYAGIAFPPSLPNGFVIFDRGRLR